MVGRQSPLSVCLFGVFAPLLPAMCERIHTVSLPSPPDKSRKTFSRSHFHGGVDSSDWGQIKGQQHTMPGFVPVVMILPF